MLKIKLSGGDKLLKRLEKKEKGKKTAYVGFFPKSIYPSGEHIASVAFWNEYGTDTIPPRPFFRTAIADNKKKWFKIIKDGVKKNESNRALERALKEAGHEAVNDVKRSILSWDTPANAPSTIKRKGFNNPLVDTRTMANSVDMELEK